MNYKDYIRKFAEDFVVLEQPKQVELIPDYKFKEIQREIELLDINRPASKQEYLEKREKLQSNLNELYRKNNDINESNHSSLQQYIELRSQKITEAMESADVKWQAIRQIRNEKIAETDWTQMQDVHLTYDELEKYRVYRQALRDITKQPHPDEIIWPEL